LTKLFSHGAVKNGLFESSILDFKRDAYSDSKEFLKDVTAFANTRGGRIILGVDEDAHGKANTLVGLQIDKLDQEIQRLQNWLREHSEPDVSGVVRIIPEIDEQDRVFLVVDVEESAIAPHRLKVESQKFNRHVYVRKGRDNVPVGMNEIRDIVVDNLRTPRMIDAFVSERLKELTIASPTGRHEPISLVFHICPLRGFGSRSLVDWALENRNSTSWADPSHWSAVRPNALGAVCEVPQFTSRDSGSYIQLFYNSCAELLFNHLLHTTGEDGDTNRGTYLPAVWIRNYCTADLPQIVRKMSRATGCDQFVVRSQLSGVGDYKLIWNDNNHFPQTSRHTPMRQHVQLPPVTIWIEPSGELAQAPIDDLCNLIFRSWGQDGLKLPK
jgi:hypothetical protein